MSDWAKERDEPWQLLATEPYCTVSSGPGRSPTMPPVLMIIWNSLDRRYFSFLGSLLEPAIVSHICACE